ncbi:hypothetical protein [Bartonella australis]|uniref:hypothetical protein n=1 Tax=Bartonella australis TaxID=388640 RepID=UPI00034B7AFE|nr:hypothetical protein [Bartonella australis]
MNVKYLIVVSVLILGSMSAAQGAGFVAVKESNIVPSFAVVTSSPSGSASVSPILVKGRGNPKLHRGPKWKSAWSRGPFAY